MVPLDLELNVDVDSLWAVHYNHWNVSAKLRFAEVRLGHVRLAYVMLG